MKKSLLAFIFCSTAWSQVGLGIGVQIGGPAASDTRPTVTATTGKTATLTASGTTTVFTISGAGTITSLHLTVGATGADSPNMLQNSTMSINCDSNPQTVPLGLFFRTQGAPTAFNTDSVSVPLMSSTFVNYTSLTHANLWINYASSCSIAITNASSTATANIYFDTQYRVGADPNPGLRAHWNAHYVTPTAVVANTNAWNTAQFAILPTVTTTNGGMLDEVVVYYNSSNDYTYLEGTPTVYADGTLSNQANGGEDWALCGYYCGFPTPTNTVHTNRSGFATTAVGLQDSTGTKDTVMYRAFDVYPADNLTFTSTLAVYVANGGNNFGSPGTINIGGLVTYFTK